MRILIGGIFSAAGASKILDPEAFAQTIWSYAILPDMFINILAVTLPFWELTAGLLLILGLLTESSAVFLALLSLAFGLSSLSADWRGLDVECGCFGAWGFKVGPTTWLLDLILMVGSIYLARRGAGGLSLDHRCFRE